MFRTLGVWMACLVVGLPSAHAQTEVVLDQYQLGGDVLYYTDVGPGLWDYYPLFGQRFTPGVTGSLDHVFVRVQSDIGYPQSGIFVSVSNWTTGEYVYVFVPEDTDWTDLGWREASFAETGITLTAGDDCVLWVETYYPEEHYRLFFSISDGTNDYYPSGALIEYYYDDGYGDYLGGLADMLFATYMEVEVSEPPLPCVPGSGDPNCQTVLDQFQPYFSYFYAPVGALGGDYPIYSQTFAPEVTGYLDFLRIVVGIDFFYPQVPQAGIRVSLYDVTSGELLWSGEVVDTSSWLGPEWRTMDVASNDLVPLYADSTYSIVVEAIDPSEHYFLYLDWSATVDPYSRGVMQEYLGSGPITWSDYPENGGYADMAFKTYMIVPYEPPPPEPTPVCMATGDNSAADGYLEVCADDYGAVATDLFNPAGAAYGPESATFRSNVFFFLEDASARAVLSSNDDYEDGSVVTEVTSVSQLDMDLDGIDDRLESQFTLASGSTLLVFDLAQWVVESGPGVATYIREYTITNGEGSPAVDFSLVVHLDADLYWVGDYADNVGTRTNGWQLDRSVYISEHDGSLPVGETALTLSSPTGSHYYGTKLGVYPPGSDTPMGYGTDDQLWDGYGVPTPWENFIPDVGCDTNGDSGTEPSGSTDPYDAAIGLEVPVSLEPDESTTVTFSTTYGQILPDDIDDDGLLEEDELAEGTDPNNPDTDGDGLTDGEEVHTYLTDPLDVDTDGDGLLDGEEVAGGTEPTIFDVEIDIKPGGEPNCVNVNGHGVIPVAILGSDYLDVTDIAFETVRLEGMPIRAVGRTHRLLYSFVDLNGDEYLDVVMQIEDTGLSFVDATEATLTGQLFDTAEFQGTDTICIVPRAGLQP